MTTFTAFIDVTTHNWLNHRGHWRKQRAETKQIKEATIARLLEAGVRKATGARRIAVLLTRNYRDNSRRMDPPNVMMALKPVVDGIAHVIGIDDKEDIYEWSCAQNKSPVVGVSVRIEIESGE